MKTPEKRIREISIDVENETEDQREDRHLRFIWTHEQMILIAERYAKEFAKAELEKVREELIRKMPSTPVLAVAGCKIIDKKIKEL